MRGTPVSNRLHIGIFGKRNVGKSTLINSLTGQDVAIVSEVPGTTTDPVNKAMEIHDIGPVLITDTGGIDDEGLIGDMRVEKAYKVLNKTDISLLVIDKDSGLGEYEEKFLKEIESRRIPGLVVVNKIDISQKNGELSEFLKSRKLNYIEVSALNKTGMDSLRQRIVKMVPDDFERKTILSDLLKPGSLVVIVAPLDMEAPKGRLKIPQVQAMRDLLDINCSTIMVKENGLKALLKSLKQKPNLIITESQIFAKAKDVLPEDILLTSFSILYARYKGDLGILANGVKYIDKLKSGDKILIAEACTHHPIGDDIGRVLIPGLLNKRLKNKNIKIDYCAGFDFPNDLKDYKLIVHCGGCMLNRREMIHRINSAREVSVPTTNYGMVIAHCNGMLEKALKPFGIF